MKAYQVTTPGGIEDIKALELAEPEPGPGEVKVKIHAASLNYRDFGIAEGGYYRNDTRPIVPLSDGAGEVVAVGDGVTRFALGDRVCPIFVRDWVSGAVNEHHLQSCLGGSVDGVLREYVVYPEHAFVAIPHNYTYAQAATLPCAAVTAWNALFEAGDVSSADTVLLLGTGGVSTFAFQFARAVGAKIILTSSHESKLDQFRDMGLTQGINYVDSPEWHKDVQRITEQRGVDTVLEVGGPGTLERSLKSVRVGGQVQLIGVLDTPTAKIAPMLTVFNALTIRGIYVGSREMFERMLMFISKHDIQPIIDKEYPFHSALDAYRYMRSQKHIGKVVITF